MKSFVTGCVLVGFVVLVAAVSLVWLPYDPADTSGGRLAPPGGAHLLGTDKLGRDLLTQLMIGARIALAAGAGSVLLGALIAFPTLLLAMLVVAVREASLGSAILAIGLAMSAVVARLTRVLVKRVLAQDYITAARTSGGSWPRIIAEHVLPNIWPTLMVNLALQLGLAVLAEASLSYLGLGPPPPNASWGRLLQEAQATVLTAPVGAIAPGLLLVVLVIGTNLVADGLRGLGGGRSR